MTVPAKPLPNTPATPNWRWPLLWLLAAFVALLSNSVLLTQVPTNRLDQALTSGDNHWLISSHQELSASAKRPATSSSTEHSDTDSYLPDLQPVLWLLLAGLISTVLRLYFRAQTRLIPLRTNAAPRSPRAPPA